MKRFCKCGVCLIMTAVLLFALLPAGAAAADSKEEMRRAIVETAIAYYLNGVDQQYDSMPLAKNYQRDAGGNIRHWHFYAPEEATPDQTMFSVCSEYAFEVVYNALGYKLLGDPRRSTTGRLYEESEGPIVVFKFDNRKVSEEEADAAAERAWSLLQPGDVVVDRIEKSGGSASGHAMMFVGDIDGDGVPDILHSSGKKYNMKTGVEAFEKNGTVRINNAEEYFHTKGQKRYFGGRSTYAILRPVDAADQPLAITPSARTRMRYPWMRCVHTVSAGCYGAAEQGGELTYSLKIHNRGGQDFKELPVVYTVPEGTELIKASDGVSVSGKNLAWTVDLPAGETKELTVNVKVTAPLGAEIVSDGGKVGEIPMKVLTTVVGGSRKGLEQLKNFEEIGKKLSGEKRLNGTAFANAVYRGGMGVEIGLPDAGALFDAICTKANIPKRDFYTIREDYRGSTVGKMVVRHWIGGRQYTAKDTRERVAETRLRDLQVGDLLFVAEAIPMADATMKAYYYNGTDLIAYKSGALVKEDPVEVEKLLSRPFFVALRPAQAFENLSAQVSAAERFTDVKRTDWFYDCVSELAADGVIGGMTETTFVPNGTLTYGQALKLVALAVGEKEPAKSGTHWASGWLTLAKSKGWLTGDVDLDGAITRLAFCRIAAKAKGLQEGKAFNPFTDTDDPAVLALYQAKVINGMTATEFQPDGLLTRAQIAKIIRTLRKI